MSKVRALFKVMAIRQDHWNPQARTIELSAQYDTSIPKEKRFYDATPSATMSMTVNNPAAIESLALGKAFYVDFTPVEEASEV